MTDLLTFLLSTELFKGVDKNIIESTVIPAGKREQYPEGKSLYAPQDRVDDLIMLIHGKVNLVNYLENGNCDLREQLSTGSVVALDLLATRTRLSPYLAVVVTDAEVFRIPSRIIFTPGRIPEGQRSIILKNYLFVLSRINMKKEYRLAILTHQSLRDRIMIYLMMQAKKIGSNTFTIPFSRDEMASFLCVNRSALSHELGLLKNEGIIDFKKNSFELKRKTAQELPFD